MEIKYIFVAEAANVSSDNRLNVLGAFQALAAPNFPVAHPQLAVVLALSPKPMDAGQVRKIGVRLITEDGTEMLRVEADANVNPPPMPAFVSTTYHIMKFVNLVFPKPGTYEFIVSVDGQHAGSASINLSKWTGPMPG